MSISLELIQKLPKTDLHCHLDGSLRTKTILDLAKEQGVTLPAHTEQELFQQVYAGSHCESLEDYLKSFAITLSVLQTKEALYRVAYELIEDCAKENVRYLEVRYAPILHQEKGLKLSQIVEAVLAGLKAGEQKFGVKSGVILCAIRSMSKEKALETAKLCAEYKNRGVVAFDLAGAEKNFPPTLHLEALEIIHKNHLACTIHAGEAEGPISMEQALYPCGTQRFGHGTRLHENPDLKAYVRDRQIPLEVCISSNVQTKAVSDFSSHPLPTYYREGILVTINTDNRLVTNTTVSQELLLCHEHYGLSLLDIKQLIRNGFHSAF